MKCLWSHEEEDVYDTECDNTFILINGSLTENEFKFCPYCGGEIEEDND